jgi:hypothetical protein
MRRGRRFSGWLIALGLAGSVLVLPSASQAFTTNPFAGPAGQGNFNFDTSEGLISGGTFANFNGDPGGVAHNEANASCGPGCEFFLGYADNAHTNACLDNEPTAGTGNCIPSDPGGNNVWDGTGGSLPAEFFLGSAVGAAPGCDRPGVAPCFDAGAIQFHAVALPQPSALLLLGGGLMGLAAWGRRWSQYEPLRQRTRHPHRR